MSTIVDLKPLSGFKNSKSLNMSRSGKSTSTSFNSCLGINNSRPINNLIFL